MRSRTRTAAAAVVAALLLASCSAEDGASDANTVPSSGPTIVDTLEDEGFSTLSQAIEAAGLARTLAGEGLFTIFAPTDEAFAALPGNLLETLLLPGNSATLVAILTYHVVPGEVLANDIKAGKVTTVQGEAITVATEGGVTVNDANVVTTDLGASNGVIHGIDAVILPPDLDLSNF
jgi:uncharacterized surface protein with fasciclin (FAS1) repeats